MVTIGRHSLLEERGEVTIGRGIMGDYDTYVFFVGIYPDVDTAEQDYQAVKDLYYEMNLIDTFDAAVIGKNESGNVKIYRKHEQPTRNGGWASWGLATGLVVALIPAAAVGDGRPAGTTAAGAGIGAVAAHVSVGMSRGDLKDLGETLDAGEAALVVAAASDVANMVEASMSHAEKIDSKQARIDTDKLETDSKEAQKEGSS